MTIEDIVIKSARRIYNKLYPNHRGSQPITDNYLGVPITTPVQGNQLVADFVSSGKPFMAARIGHTELSCLINYIEINQLHEESGVKKIWSRIKGRSIDWEPSVIDAMHRMSGVYPCTEKNLEKFSELYFKEIGNVDILGVWHNFYEDKICHQFCPDAKLVPLMSLEPYYFEHPWSEHLKGKKVLVIHPFEDSIKKQFPVKDFLFEDKNVLPDFELRTIKAFQTAMYRTSEYPDWFAALEALQEKITKTDFDIAIIGAGAYGLPLASFIKRMGKQAVHMGGATQILFGIKGNRWDAMPVINKFYNKYWTRPFPEETPENNKIMEGGSYW